MHEHADRLFPSAPGIPVSCSLKRRMLSVALLLLSLAALAPAATGIDNGSSTAEQGNAPPAAGRRSTSDGVNPIYYPYSPTAHLNAVTGGDEIDRLLDRFLHLHTSMRYEDALAVINELAAQRPENPVIHYNRACVLGRLLRTDEALDALEKSVELGWRNLTQIRTDPDLHAIRWHDRFKQIDQHLAAIIRRSKPSAGPLRDDPWDEVVRDLQAVMPELFRDETISTVSIAFVNAGEHVWTGSFSAAPDPDSGATEPSVNRDASRMQPRRIRVDGPAHLLGLIGVLDRFDSSHEPGVLRVVDLCRHAVRNDPALRQAVRPVGRGRNASDVQDAAGVFSRDQRGRVTGNRQLLGGRMIRIANVPDDVHDLFRMSVEHLSGSTFARYCHERLFPSIGMDESRLVSATGSNHRTVQPAAHEQRPSEDRRMAQRRKRADRHGLVLETTVDDLAALLAHVLDADRTTRAHAMHWRQVCDHLLRACVTRSLSIGSNLSIKRTPFGIRTDVVSFDEGAECLMRWHAESRTGVIVIVEGEGNEGGRSSAAARLAHLALGGQPD